VTIYAQNVLTDNFYEKFDFLQVTLLCVVQGSINWKISPLRGISVDVLRGENIKRGRENSGKKRKKQERKNEERRKKKQK
jgi:hypothetical protein